MRSSLVHVRVEAAEPRVVETAIIPALMSWAISLQSLGQAVSPGTCADEACAACTASRSRSLLANETRVLRWTNSRCRAGLAALLAEDAVEHGTLLLRRRRVWQPEASPELSRPSSVGTWTFAAGECLSELLASRLDRRAGPDALRGLSRPGSG